ncbi:MAG: ATP synthase F1 subunit gamma [Dehalococcoidia bacterium]|nr:ATP synthase F1 subunit gamma [Dehalococcoidia bacterium]
MANIRVIRRRIRSIQSTAKITKAMEMVATSKMRRAQERVLAGRPYAEKIQQVLADLAAQQGSSVHPLLERREVNRVQVIHITADRGLCGGLNTNMNRSTATFILEQVAPIVLITVGRKGREFMLRYGRDVRAEFTGISDRPSLLDTVPISRIVIDDYTSGLVDRVYLAYTRFVTTMTQRPVVQQLLPVEPARMERGGEIEYIYEPTSRVVLAELLPRFVEMEVYHAILESIASEQSTRMVAMRNATENANEMIEDLTLVYNKVRQEMITRELLDITGGAEALV